MISYHLGKTCRKEDLKITLKAALKKLSAEELKTLIIRSDNGPQMSTNGFKGDVLKVSIELMNLHRLEVQIKMLMENRFFQYLIQNLFKLDIFHQ